MHNTSKINLILWSSDVDQMPSDIPLSEGIRIKILRFASEMILRPEVRAFICENEQ